MEKFAKVFDFDDNNQLLVTIRYKNDDDPAYVVSLEINTEGSLIDIQFKYETEKTARLLFNSIDYEIALDYRKKILDIYNNTTMEDKI